jgi:hypothetical protein
MTKTTQTLLLGAALGFVAAKLLEKNTVSGIGRRNPWAGLEKSYEPYQFRLYNPRPDTSVELSLTV